MADVTWESKSGWTQASKGYANVSWFGAVTPGTTSDFYSFDEFQIMQQASGNENYIAIATGNIGQTGSGSISSSKVVAVSNNKVNPSGSEGSLHTYYFDSPVVLQGGTTYYVLFLSSNTPSGGNYSVRQGRISLNHTGYGTYTPGIQNSTTSTWWPYYTATLTPVVTVNVTYNLYESDGVTFVTSLVKQQLSGSEVAVPWNSSYFNYATEGTIGSEDCAIKVTRTLKDNTVVYPIANLSNTKAYTLTTQRGTLGTNGTQMVSTYTTSYSAGNFALISYEDNLYLYSVADSKFVANPSTISGVANQPGLTEDLSNVSPVTLELTDAPYFYMQMGSNGVNVSNYATGIVVNSWTTKDEGNQYVIQEAADFDPTDALAQLTAYFSIPSQLVHAINALNAKNYGSGYGQLGFTGSYAEYKGQETTKIATILSNANTALTSGTTDEMEASITEINDVISNLALNLPANGSVFRLKSVHDTYMTNVAAIKEKTSYRNTLTADATDPNTIMFYVDGKIYCYGTGSEVMGSGSTFYTSVQSWEFLESSITPYKYAVRYTASGSNNIPETKYLFAWGPSSSYPNSMDHNSADAANCAFTIEAVENIPVEVSDALHATLYLPVGVQAVDGLTLNSVTSKGNDYLALNEVAKVAAKTPVIVKADAAGTYNLPVVNDGETVDGNLLTGVAFGGETIAPEVNAYILGQDEQGVGLFPLSSTGRTLASWKAYYVPAGETSARAFYFSDVTGLNKANLQNANEGVTYDLQGRRVQNAQKGLYIVNGKKVLVK